MKYKKYEEQTLSSILLSWHLSKVQTIKTTTKNKRLGKTFWCSHCCCGGFCTITTALSTLTLNCSTCKKSYPTSCKILKISILSLQTSRHTQIQANTIPPSLNSQFTVETATITFSSSKPFTPLPVPEKKHMLGQSAYSLLPVTLANYTGDTPFQFAPFQSISQSILL